MRSYSTLIFLFIFLNSFQSKGQCFSAPNGQYPSGSFTPSCTGSNQNITTLGYAGEYSVVNIIAGNSYTFSSSVGTDFITISNAAGTVSYATGTGSVTWVATFTGQIRFYTHVSSACGAQSVSRTRRVSCSTPPTISCSGNFYDSGGSGGNYTNNENNTYVICPSVAGQCVSVQFTSWDVESGWDYMYVYDGNSTAASQVTGSPFSASSPGIITGSATNASGCLTFRFSSDGSTTRPGWAATISCASCGTLPSATAQDCGGGTTICSNTSFSGNSNAGGNYNDFTAANTDCLDPPEHQTSWYYFSSTTNGTIGMTITPALTTDDYDWAIWGPVGSITCPPSSAPIRCSAADGNGTPANITGLGNGASDVSEGPFGNGWVSSLNVLAGQIYIMVLDNWTASSSPFTLSWQLSNGANLNCAPLPMELLNFYGKKEEKQNYLAWTTASELNNDYFTLERSPDSQDFISFHILDAAGNSITNRNYSAIDESPYNGITYYRLKQTDFDGKFTYSSIVAVENKLNEIAVSNIHPNPVSDNLSFDFSSPGAGTVHIQILDFTGRIVVDEFQNIESGKSSLKANMSTLAKGVYSLCISFNDGKYRSITKIIKQ